MNPEGDIFNHANVHFWEYSQVRCAALCCAGPAHPAAAEGSRPARCTRLAVRWPHPPPMACPCSPATTPWASSRAPAPTSCCAPRPSSRWAGTGCLSVCGKGLAGAHPAQCRSASRPVYRMGCFGCRHTQTKALATWTIGSLFWGQGVCGKPHPSTYQTSSCRRCPLQAGWFPEWTLTEDFALGIELKKLNWQASGQAPQG